MIEEGVPEAVKVVAYHEAGHAIIGEQVGAIVKAEVVVSRNFGYTLLLFNNIPSEERAEAVMLTLASGEVAEEKIGHTDHSGAGSDRNHLYHLAQAVSKFKYLGRISPSDLIIEVYRKARSLLSEAVLTNHVIKVHGSESTL